MSDNNSQTLQSAHKPSVYIPGEEHEMQLLVDSLFADTKTVDRLDVLVKAETDDLSDDIIEIIKLLPKGTYKRGHLCDQLNSIIVAHGWGYIWGTVE